MFGIDLEDSGLAMPAEWYKPAAWSRVREYLAWLPVDYSTRKHILLEWADEAGVKLTRYHYESIAREGEQYTEAGVA